MVSEVRFNRLEDKVDKVDEKVDVVDKTTVEIRAKLENHIDLVEQHVLSDTRIVKHIEPLLPHLSSIAEMAQDHQFQKRKREERINTFKLHSDKIKVWGGALGLISAALAIIAKYTNFI